MVVVARLLLALTLAAGPSDPSVAFRISDPRITEASGIAVGRISPGVAYVQNDSGDTNRFFAIDRRTGRTAATVTVPGVENVDWEDLAVGPNRAGRSSVWIGDIGANEPRAEVRVYRVPEPRVAAGADDTSVTAGAPDVWRLHYPDGAQHNAESLAVDPRGTAYVVTKSPTGASVVYRVPARPDASRVQPLVRVAPVSFRFTGTRNPFGPPGQLLATGAAFSRDGRLFVVRTYSDAYVWRVAGSTDGDLAAALRTQPGRVAMPPRQMGEGITFDGARLLVDAEGRDQAVYAIALPRIPTAAASPGSSSAPSPAPSRTAPNMGDGSPATTLAILAGGAAGVVVLAGLGVWTARRLWRRAVAKRPTSAG